MAKGKASSVAKSLRNGQNRRRAKRVFHKVHFYKPHTKILARNPKVAPVVRHLPKLDSYAVLKHALTTESAMNEVEANNTLVFLVNLKSNKRQIKFAMESIHGVAVTRVNTLIRPDGQKKAFIKLSPDHDALDVANRIGII